MKKSKKQLIQKRHCYIETRNHERMNKLKLSTKISLLLCAALVVIFAVLISISALSSSSSLQVTAFGQMQAMTEKSGAEIEKILSIAESTTKSMSSYMQTAYQKKDASGTAADETAAVEAPLEQPRVTQL